MKLIAQYLERSLQFEQMAAESADPAFKTELLKQAAAYRKLASERALRLNLPVPPSQEPTPSE